ncbi:MAG: tRNA dihydrouridine(20/20a) synthase DusA, partial [Vibrio sp.]
MNREQKIHNSLQNIDLSSNIDVSKSWRFSVAPMLDWTDRHCRYFHRILS